MSAPAIHVRQARCRMCQRFRAPEEFAGGVQIGYCLHCLGWHEHALDVLAGDPPKGCQGCGLNFDQLQALSPTDDVRLRLERKDGIYQLLCVPCSDAYQKKTAERFRGTPYGWLRKLDGVK